MHPGDTSDGRELEEEQVEGAGLNRRFDPPFHNNTGIKNHLHGMVSYASMPWVVAHLRLGAVSVVNFPYRTVESWIKIANAILFFTSRSNETTSGLNRQTWSRPEKFLLKLYY